MRAHHEDGQRRHRPLRSRLEQYDLFFHAERGPADLPEVRRPGLGVAGQLPRSGEPGARAAAGAGIRPQLPGRRVEEGGAPHAAVPPRDSAAGRTHARAPCVRRVSPDRRLSEHPARAGRHAGQAEAPVPFAGHQDPRHLPGRAERPRGQRSSGRRRRGRHETR